MTPHYVRVARALALASSARTSRVLLSGALASGVLAGCYESHERDVDAGPIDAWSADANADVGPCPEPLPCTCPTLASMGTCGATSFASCCAVVGPLDPPDLVV